MEARAIQIYKPVNKNEVRLVYRIKNSLISGENGRHQKSYSFNKYGQENAWNMARDAFKYINTNNKLPFDFSDPWKMKLINKKGKKNQNSINKQINNNLTENIISGDTVVSNMSKRLSSIKDNIFNLDLKKNSNKINVISNSITKNYNSFHHLHDISPDSNNLTASVSPEFVKFEKSYNFFDYKQGKNDIGSSYLYLLATVATEIMEKEENSKLNDEISNEIFEHPIKNFSKSDQINDNSKNSILTCDNTIKNNESYVNITDKNSNIPLIFNQDNQYTTALFNSINRLMIMEPPFIYSNNNFHFPK